MPETKKSNKNEWKPRTLPKGMTVKQMEEIFTDRLANLIVQLLDYQHEQKLKAQATGESKPEDNNKSHA